MTPLKALLPSPRRVVSVLTTAILVAVAIAVGRWLWHHYMVEPWTRDARVRADFVQVAPDVSGLVASVLVRDNQEIRVGDVLFVVDQARYQLAVADAEQKLADQHAQVAQAERENQRNLALGDLASSETREEGNAKLQELHATLGQAATTLNLARLNLARTVVRSTVNGAVTDLNLRPGDYFTAGRPALTIIDRGSFYVVGYFEETKLARIHIGDSVRIRLMGEGRILDGHVESVTRAIEDRERTPDTNLIPNVNPTFNWVRLAQRIPVRIAIDHEPPDVLLVMGRTATVEVVAQSKRSRGR